MNNHRYSRCLPLLALLASVSLGLSSCDIYAGIPIDNSSTSSSSMNDLEKKLHSIYELGITQGAISSTTTYEEWLASIKGEDGKDGSNGADGVTPHIGDNGDWYIGDTDTGVRATGDDGADGASVLTGSGVPEATLGKDGDSYIDTDTWDIYLKSSGAWSKSGNIKGDDGAKGDKGDTGDVGSNGSSILTGSGVPSAELGKDGDSYIDTATWDIYLKASGAWAKSGNIKGDTGNVGADGSSVYTGTGTPSADLGKDGDSYIDVGTWDYYVKVSGAWSKSGNIKGGTGDKGDSGKSAYEIYCAAHPEYTGTEAEWMDDLVNGRLATKSTYTVTFVVNEETYKTEQVEEGKNATKPDDPSTKGFLGWYDENGDKWVFNGYVITKDITLTAKWSDDIKLVYLYDGTTKYKLMTGAAGDVITLPAVANTASQTFEGWKNSGGTEVATDYTISVSETLTSAWHHKRINFDAGEGSVTPLTLDVTTGESTGDLPKAARDGFLFNVWKNGTDSYKDPFVYTFDGDATLTAEYIAVGDAFNYINKGTYIEITSYTSSSKDVEIPSTIESLPVTTLDAGMFDSHKDIESVSFPSSLTVYPDGLLTGCSSIKKLIVPDNISSTIKKLFGVTVSADLPVSFDTIEFQTGFSAWPTSFFAGDTIKYTIVLPNGMDSVGCDMFKNISQMKSILLPNTILSIESYAFYGCISLISINIPDSVTTIKNNAFEACSLLKEISLGKGLLNLSESVFYSCTSLQSIDIPNGVSVISDCLFRNCYSLVSASLPASIVSIESYAFYGCDSLVSVSLHEGLTTIGNNAFYACKSLVSLNFPESLISIGESAFYSCSSLTSVTIPKESTSINSGVFGYCSSVTSVTIPEGVNSIGTGAFCCMSSLKSIDVPEGVVSIGDSAFCGCTSLTSMNLPRGITSIGVDLFMGCSSLTSVTIPDDFASIPYCMFGDCPSLISVNIPSSVTNIDAAAFTRCSSLVSIDIPDSVTTIRAQTFQSCSSLASFTFPSKMTTVENQLFWDCPSLSSVTWPEQLTTICDKAFCGCSSLKSIVLPSSVTSLGECAFDPSTTVYSLASEAGANWDSNWHNYGTNHYFYSETEKAGYWHYVDNVPTLW